MLVVMSNFTFKQTRYIDIIRRSRGLFRVESVSAHIDHVLNSTDAFKRMDSNKKKCYRPKGEKKLKHFEEYSEADCMLECAWSLALKHCNCVPWYMGHIFHTEDICETFGNRLVH